MRALLPLTALGAATIAGCGGGDPASSGDGLTVSAASSLTGAFESYAEQTSTDERFEFAGSDDLAAQIRQGAAPDVYAAADVELPEALHEEGLMEKPEVFATNTLVIGVPAEGSTVDSIEDLGRPGVDLIVGSEDAPFGAYAREALDRLPASEREAVLANVRSEESDVKAAVGKIALGAADAGFVYASDVSAASGELDAVQLPSKLQPTVEYGIAVVAGAENPDGAREFVDGLLAGHGARTLSDAGFGLPGGG